MINPSLITILGAFATLQCPPTTLVDKSGLGWKKHDLELVKINKNFCAERRPESPCVFKVLKLGVRRYHIVCAKLKETK